MKRLEYGYCAVTSAGFRGVLIDHPVGCSIGITPHMHHDCIFCDGEIFSPQSEYFAYSHAVEER